MTAPAKRRGRPPHPPAEVRTVHLDVRVTAAELADLAEAARRAGQPLGTWVRGLALAAARER